MNPDWKRIGGDVVASLDTPARLRAAVYLEPRVYERDAQIAVAREAIVATEPSILAFIDLEPHLNWSHACRYVVYGLQSGTMRTISAQFPPAGDRLRLVHRGEAVEDWMLLTREQ
jgi:hypothetical protein